MNGVSVLICCYNSTKRLPETLKSLSLQKINSNIPWEILIIDNNSTDGTGSFSFNFWKALGEPAPLRVVVEPEPGLSHARKKGVDESSFDYLIFCDDDNWLNPNYIEIASSLLSKYQKVGVLGGNGEPIFEITPPAWFLDGNYQKGLATGPQGDLEGPVSKSRNFVYGAGMVTRKELVKKIFETPLFLEDRKGNLLTSGGDVELCFRSILMGYEVWYSPRLVFKHYIPEGRTSLNYIKRLSKGKGYSVVSLNAYKMVLSNSPYLNKKLLWLRLALRQLFLILKLTIIRPFGKEKNIQRIISKEVAIGKLSAYFKLRFDFDRMLKKIKTLAANNF